MHAIGITGGVGAGKSAVLKYLKEKYGAYIIVADELAKELEEPGQPVFNELIKSFGESILGADGAIDKKAFADMIFSNEEFLAKANSIIHPAVKVEILKQMEDKKRESCLLFVVEAALLIEEGYDKILDELWYIYADEAVRFKRLSENRGYSREKTLSIMRRQKSDIEFRKYCRRIIDNSCDLTEMENQIDACIYTLKGK